MAAVVEENWQTKLSTIAERIAFIFNNELLSDVKFVIRASNGEGEVKRMKMVIPAHKFVLAINSPVFFAMFYGQMAETTDSIELPDCEYESLLELFRYLYSDQVNLSGSNVMQVLYLAKKYMVPSLAAKCTEYLGRNLKVSNVLCILPNALKFEDKDLEYRCWKVIEKQTEEAVTSDDFLTLERSIVESVVKREALTVKEVELFKAVDRWATKESERQGMTPDGEVKRRILGEKIVKAIRFPLMTQQEFASVVFDSCILTFREVGGMMKHYSGVLSSPLPFIQTPRKKWAISYRCRRYESSSSSYGSTAEKHSVFFTVNKPIVLHGVQHFGSKGGEYTVSIEVKDTTDDYSLVKLSEKYSSQKCEPYTYYGFDVMFDRLVCLEEGRKYEIVSLIKGPMAWCGKKGNTSVECKGVQFTFTSPNYFTRGQFPEFVFSYY